MPALEKDYTKLYSVVWQKCFRIETNVDNSMPDKMFLKLPHDALTQIIFWLVSLKGSNCQFSSLRYQ